MRLSSKTALAAFLAAAVVVSAPAVEPDKYVPSDAEGVLVVNVQQMLDSALVKKYGQDHMKAFLQSNADAQKFLKATGLDPLKDIHKIIIAGSTNGGEPKFVGVVHGKFDVNKIQDAVAAQAKEKGEDLEVLNKGGLKIYKFKGKGASDKPVFATFADDHTAIFSPSPDQTESAAKGGGGKPNAELVRALDKLGGTESIYGAGVVTDEMKKGMANNPQFKDVAPKLQFFTGSFDVTNDLKLRLTVQTSDAKAADKVKMTLSQFVPILGIMAAGQSENLGPTVNELVKKIEIKKDDQHAVNVSLTVTEEMMKQMEDAAKGGGKKQKDKE
jgi:hypothetical protein